MVLRICVFVELSCPFTKFHAKALRWRLFSENSVPPIINYLPTLVLFVYVLLYVVDEDLQEIRLTLWNNKVDLIKVEQLESHPVIALKGVRVREYNSYRTVSSISGK